MPHDVTKADLWYHDAIVPTVHIGNNIHLLLRKDYSKEEREIILNKTLIDIEKNRAIIYEEYLEKRRLENGG